MLRQRLVDGLSEELEESALVMAYLSPERTQRILSDARDKAAVELAAGCDAKALRQHVEALYAESRLGPALLMRAVVAGNLALAAEALALLGRVPTKRVVALLAGGSESALRTLWLRAGLPAFALAPFARLLAGCRGGRCPNDHEMESALLMCRDSTDAGSDRVRQVLSRLAHERAVETARLETGGHFVAA